MKNTTSIDYDYQVVLKFLKEGNTIKEIKNQLSESPVYLYSHVWDLLGVSDDKYGTLITLDQQTLSSKNKQEGAT